MNEADSEYMARLFRRRGFSLADKLDEADAVIVNTCTVRQLAEDKAVSQIGRLKYWKKSHPEGKLFVTGCAAQRIGAKKIKKRFPYVDEITGARSIENFDRLIDSVYRKNKISGEEGKKEIPENTGPENIYRSPLTAYVTIMRGCSHRCSYCIVPSVRGPATFISREEIIKDAKEKLAAGARELVLLGQTVNSYRLSGFTFSNLLEEILVLPGLERLRFMSPHPLYFDRDFKRILKQNSRLARHIHLPVQSGSDRILKLMRRGYTHQQYLELLAELRAEVLDMSFTTDFIVGYPGETEEDFQETLRLVEEAGFTAAFCFKYSPRTDRPEMAADISDKIMESRLDILLKAVKKNSRVILRERIGKIEEVMFETPDFGRSSSNMAVRINSETAPGSIRKVEILSAERNTLHGKVIL